MAVPKAPYLIDLPGAGRGLVQTTAVSESIATTLGLTPFVRGTTEPGAKQSVRSLMNSGAAARIRVTYLDGTKRKKKDLLCAADKLDTACADLLGLNIADGVAIRTAYFPTRVRFQ